MNSRKMHKTERLDGQEFGMRTAIASRDRGIRTSESLVSQPRQRSEEKRRENTASEREEVKVRLEGQEIAEEKAIFAAGRGG